ncbi:MAG: FAD-dependent oxidoreductase [Candidatus Tumulicola sp.]
MTYDIVIVGGSLGGCAAAIAASGGSFSVCVLETSAWLGGQYSAQGVTRPDDSQYTASVGSTAAYRAFQQDVRNYYRANFKLSPAGAAQTAFNPGGAGGGFATSPSVAHQILLQHLQSPNVHVRLNVRVTAATVQDTTIQSVTILDGDGVETVVAAKYFLDATDLGDLLVLAGVEYTLGAEARSETLEPNAPAVARPDWIQPITVVAALERRPEGETHTIAEPNDYQALKAQQKFAIQSGYVKTMFLPPTDLWGYRRYIAAANFSDPALPYDLSMLNMGANDYQAATIPTGDAAKDAAIVEAAHQATLAYVYWLQTEAPRDDGKGNGYPNLRLCPDEFATPDGAAPQPYIRESRRINAQYTIVQQDVDRSLNPGPRAKNYDDSCGIGFYGALDIHALGGAGMGEQWIAINPFEIPLRSLIPIRVTNLLPACKNIGTTHITNGAYRLHPVEWCVGEAAGTLALDALTNGVAPNQYPSDGAKLRRYQQRLLRRGAPIFWWTDVHFGDAWFAAAHLMGVAGIMTGTDSTMNFNPAEPFPAGDQAAVNEKIGQSLDWPSGSVTRGTTAEWLVGQLGW